MPRAEVWRGKLHGPGEPVCLLFCNTVNWHASDQPEETLKSYADLVAWARRAGLLSQEEARWLLESAAGKPQQAREQLERAIELREAIYRIFSAIAHGQTPADQDMHRLNAFGSEAMGRFELVPTAEGYEWRLPEGDTQLDQLLWPLSKSAADLLTSEDLSRVGECADDRGCGYLFYDRSRNRSRKWCDMSDCGNRAKARRFYDRHGAAP